MVAKGEQSNGCGAVVASQPDEAAFSMTRKHAEHFDNFFWEKNWAIIFDKYLPKEFFLKKHLTYKNIFHILCVLQIY